MWELTDDIHLKQRSSLRGDWLLLVFPMRAHVEVWGLSRFTRILLRLYYWFFMLCLLMLSAPGRKNPFTSIVLKISETYILQKQELSEWLNIRVHTSVESMLLLCVLCYIMLPIFIPVDIRDQFAKYLKAQTISPTWALTYFCAAQLFSSMSYITVDVVPMRYFLCYHLLFQ